MLSDGFHIHHVDSNHANNHPDNLILIEAFDHFRLHGMFKLKFVGDHHRRIAPLGGKGRAAKLTKPKLRKIARKAAKARWARRQGQAKLAAFKARKNGETR